MGKGRGSKSKISAKKKHEGILLVTEQGLSAKDAAKKIGIGQSTLSKILKDYKTNGNKITMDEGNEPDISENFDSPKVAELQALKTRVKTLLREKETLKKTIAILMDDDRG